MVRADRTNQIVKLGHEAYAARDLSELESLTMSSLERVFLADSSVFLDWRNADNDGWQLDDIHLPTAWSSNHKQLYYSSLRRYDPIFQWLDQGAFRQAFSATRLSDLIDRREFEKGKFYNELLRQVDCSHILTIALHCGQGLIANISLLRSHKRADFDAEEEQLARMTSLCLGGTAHMLAVPPAAEDDAVTVSFDARFSMLRTTVGAIWTGPELKLDSPAQLQAFFARAPRLQQVVENAGGSAAQQKRLPRRLEERVALSASRQLHACLELHGHTGREGLFKLTLRDADKPAAALQAPQVELTTRELQIAQLAATGISSSEIGAQLCISPWTVKNHLKSVYAKTGVNNRVGLARLFR